MNLVQEKDELAFTKEEEQFQEHADKWLELFSLFIHDIESPLASIKYLLRLLEEGKYDPQKEIHQRIVKSTRIATERSESIIFDIMNIAKSGKVGLPVQISECAPDSIIREAINLVISSAEDRKINLTYKNNAGKTPVEADPELLKRMIDNLLYNAIRHTPEGGAVSVYTDRGDESVFIHVKDGGSGLGDINPAKLFEKYGQLEMRVKGKHRGVGLGLYFCKLAATGMGGTVIAEDHETGGAVFTIRLRKAGVNK